MAVAEKNEFRILHVDAEDPLHAVQANLGVNGFARSRFLSSDTFPKLQQQLAHTATLSGVKLAIIGGKMSDHSDGVDAARMVRETFAAMEPPQDIYIIALSLYPMAWGDEYVKRSEPQDLINSVQRFAERQSD